MTEAAPNRDEGQALANSIATALMQGRKQPDIVKELVKQGIPAQEAESFVSEVARGVDDFKQTPEYAEMRRAKGKKHLLVGSLWCIGGAVVTVATFSAASNGGTYVVAWGAILFGAIEAIAGLCMWLA